jgi:hypothetical protein
MQALLIRFVSQPNTGIHKACQMVYFHEKNANFGTFWKAAGWKNVWCISWPFGIFLGNYGIFFPVWVCCAKEKIWQLEFTSN